MISGILIIYLVVLGVVYYSVDDWHKYEYSFKQTESDIKNMMQLNDDGNVTDEFETQEISIDDLRNRVKIVGERTDDNPWGITAGLINIDTVGECILLTPGTWVEIKARDISFSYELFSQVRDASDGALLEILYEDYEGELVYSDVKEVSTLSDSYNFEFVANTTDVNNVNLIRFKCESGKNNNEDADWVIIRNIRVII